MPPRRTAGLAAGLVLAAAAAAQEPKADPSTAQPGQKVPSTFRSFLVADGRFPLKSAGTVTGRDDRNRSLMMHDLVVENGLSPVVAVFVRADPKDLADSGVVKLARGLDEMLKAADEPGITEAVRYRRVVNRANKLSGFVQFLQIEGAAKSVALTSPDGTAKTVELDAEFPDDEKGEALKETIGQLASAAARPPAPFRVPFGLGPANGKAAASWGLKAEDAVTVVLYSRLKVEKRWAFPATGPTDEQIAEVVKGAERVVDDIGK